MMAQLPQERLNWMWRSWCDGRRCERTIEYCKKEAFGGPIMQFQNTRLN